MAVNFDLLDASVDELVELEGFDPFPAGTYRVSIEWEKKEINDKPAVELSYVCKEVVELADPAGEEIAPGKRASVVFYLYKNDGSVNSVGQGQLRSVIKTLQESFGGDSTSEVMSNSEGAEVLITLGVKTTDRGSNNTIKSVAVV